MLKKIICLCTLCIILTGCTDGVLQNDKCQEITGGSFALFFNTNGGEELSSMSVCIACSPDSYEKLPVPKKDGYSFGGWYLDGEFTTPLEGDTTLAITPVAHFNEKGCHTGYEDAYLYAKWEKVKTSSKGNTKKVNNDEVTLKSEEIIINKDKVGEVILDEDIKKEVIRVEEPIILVPVKPKLEEK